MISPSLMYTNQFPLEKYVYHPAPELIHIPNYVPFLILVGASLCLIVLFSRKARTLQLLPFYLCMAGLVYLFEYTVLVIFVSYVYHPHLYNDSYFDSILGSIGSNGFIVPSTAVFVAVFDLGIGWMALFAACLMGVELLFLRLGVYQHFWWKTIYTGLSLLIIYVLAKWIWGRIRFQAHRLSVRLLVLYFATISALSSILFIAALLHIFMYRAGWFGEPERDHIAFVTFLVFIESFFYALTAALRAHWLWKASLVAAIAVLNQILLKFGVLKVPGYGALVLLTLIHCAVMLGISWFQKILSRQKETLA